MDIQRGKNLALLCLYKVLMHILPARAGSTYKYAGHLTKVAHSLLCSTEGPVRWPNIPTIEIVARRSLNPQCSTVEKMAI
jgi:hypothetical protein